MPNDTIYSRQLSILDPRQTDIKIVVIGCGGIGSVTIYLLSKMGFKNIVAYDPDTIEVENIPSQFFSFSQVGQSKVKAIKDTLGEHTGLSLAGHNKKYNGELAPIIICAVDSMNARHSIYNDFIKGKLAIRAYIDARMSGENGRLYAFCPLEQRDTQNYETTLYTDEQATPEPCTAKAIAYNTHFIGALIASQVKNLVMQKPIPYEIIFDLSNYAVLNSPARIL